MASDQQLWHFAENISNLSKQEPAKAQALLQAFFKEYQKQPDKLASLGAKFYKGVEYTLAGICYDTLARMYPNDPVAYNGLGMVLTRFGEAKKAAQAYAKALALKPDYKASRTNYALTLHYFGETGRSDILQAQIDVAKHLYPASKEFLKKRTINKDPKRVLKVGYLSGDLRDHPVGHFMRAILEHHSRDVFEVHVFSSHSGESDYLESDLKQLDLKWHQIDRMQASAACKRIVNQEIDVLIDLGVYMGTGRPDIVSQRVAPIQVNYLGYPDSSGMPTMDFRIGDEFADLPEYAAQNTEKMFRLPHAMWLYSPWKEMPDRRDASAFSKNGYVTFGSANNHAKLQPEWLDVWAQVLAKVPNSKLIMKSRVLDNADVRRSIFNIFEKRGVSSERLDLRHFSRDPSEHWEQMHDIDIALDAFPYNGTTTTCDMLWLGIPVMTMTGHSHVSRTSASMLHTLGLQDWIAENEEEFIEQCVRHATDLDGLGALQASLRDRMLNSSLCDPKRFIPAYEQAIRKMWLDYCQNSD